MNKSTFRKIAVMSFAAVLAPAVMHAQVANPVSDSGVSSTTTTVSTTTTNVVPNQTLATTATRSNQNLFSGAVRPKPFTVGLNLGLGMPVVLGATNLDNKDWKMNLGYGAYFEYSINPWFSVLANYQGGKLSGKYLGANGKEFDTSLHYALSAKVRLSTSGVSFLTRTPKVGLFAQAGLGFAGYKTNFDGYNDSRGNQFTTAGVGVNFKLSDALTFLLGYDMNFMGSRAMYVREDQVVNNASAHERVYPTSKWSYLYGGLEFHFGGGQGPAKKWFNPVASMYDELKGRNMENEINELKNSLNNIGVRVDALYKDTDGDGVPDPLDKEPNSAPGAVVDGAGRTIHFPQYPVVQKVTRITQQEKEVIISLSKNVYFDTGKASLKAASFPKLNEVARILRRNTCVKIQLDGHTDNTGKTALNRRLSQDRVDSVKAYLVKQGVNGSQIEAKGWGETKPIDSNKTKSGRQKNRRVEVTVDDSSC